MKKITLTLAVLLSLTLIFNSCDVNKKFIGLQLYSLRDLMKEKPDSTVMKVGEMGYSFVEAAGYNDGKFYGMSPADFKALVEESGMVFLGSHTGQGLPDSANWDKTMEWWDKAIAAHKEGGVEYIVQPWMGQEGYESLDGLKKYCEYFEAVGEKCNEAGIRFGYHNHANEFTTVLDGNTVYDYMIENTDPEKVMFQIDLYWAVEGGADPVDYFEKYPGRFWLWHVKDEKEVGASGDIDFERIWAHKETAGVKYYIVEQEEYNYPPLESVEMSLEYLQNADFVQ
ncbi:MAG: sugar phosphate isomerase/epimerase family protein [Bacteroidales bacterium]